MPLHVILSRTVIQFRAPSRFIPPTINGDDAHLPLMFRVFSLPLISFQVLEQSMVDCSSHTVYDEVTRNQRPFL
jgi:hypothetical protein